MTTVFKPAGTRHKPALHDASQIAMYLRNYAVLIGDATELAEEWATMAEQEQIHHRSLAMQIWGMRHTLGELYRTNQLTPTQVQELTRLDHALLEQAAAIETAYGPSIWQLVRNLVDWGTPLSEEEGSVQLAVPVRALPELAKHFAR
ncbi:MAG: hypothetical protein DYG89_19710 [Caldilinea sp. CFX5]|nr:hypothetical protein [Caldilinea sp. CFX5]